MGNQNSRFQSEAAPDGLIVMRKPANKRLIIVAAADLRNPVLFTGWKSKENKMFLQKRDSAIPTTDYGRWNKH